MDTESLLDLDATTYNSSTTHATFSRAVHTSHATDFMRDLHSALCPENEPKLLVRGDRTGTMQ